MQCLDPYYNHGEKKIGRKKISMRIYLWKLVELTRQKVTGSFLQYSEL